MLLKLIFLQTLLTLSTVSPSNSNYFNLNWIWSDKGSDKDSSRNDQPKSPIILVPGDGGSQLEARIDKPTTVHYVCQQRTEDFFTLWLNLAELVPHVIDCWVDNMRLIYNVTNRRTYSPPGVTIRIPGFGNTTTVEYVDPSQVSVAGYFNALVAELVKFGYKRGIDIRGAPYDFRKAPRELDEFYHKFKALVEDTYKLNGQRKVIVICHSLGCPTMLYFFNNQRQYWKNRYIKSFVTLAGAWGGAVKALKAYTSGDNFGVLTVAALTIRKEERTFPSLAYLLPSDRFWKSGEVLISTGRKNYTVNDYQQFFQDINYTIGYEMWKDTKDLTHDLKPPGITTHCMHGNGIQTMSRLHYQHTNFPNHEPRVETEDGDGTVNIRSLQGCLRWQGKQNKPVYYSNYTLVDHMAVMTDPKIFEYLKKIVVYKPEEEATGWWESFWDTISETFDKFGNEASDGRFHHRHYHNDSV